jgi:hypothetical protein
MPRYLPVHLKKVLEALKGWVFMGFFYSFVSLLQGISVTGKKPAC